MSEPEFETMKVLGKDLYCLVCDNDTFWQREAKLNTGTGGFAWADTSGACVICSNCGFIHWFHPGQIRQ